MKHKKQRNTGTHRTQRPEHEGECGTGARTPLLP